MFYGVADEVVDHLVETTRIDGSGDVGVGVEREDQARRVGDGSQR